MPEQSENVSRNPEYQMEEMDGELLLYHPGQTRTIYLNDSAATIWQLCDGSLSISGIVSVLEESYPDSKNIEADVMDTLKQMKEFGAISLKLKS